MLFFIVFSQNTCFFPLLLCALTKAPTENGSQKRFTIFPPDAMLFENDPENQSANRKDMYYVNRKNNYFGSNRAGIAAYKAANLASLLKKQHADVHVIMTKNAMEFITPLTFETLTVNKCLTDTFDRNFKFEVEHVELAKKADLAIIARRPPMSAPNWHTDLPMIC